MAKSLETPRPSSSLARLLDATSVSRAIGPAAGEGPRESVATKLPDARTTRPARPPAEAACVKREFVLSPDADAAFNALVDELRRSTGARLTASHAFRSLMRAIEPGVATMRELPRRPLRLPSNAPAFEAERARFESELARLIGLALGRPRHPDPV